MARSLREITVQEAKKTVPKSQHAGFDFLDALPTDGERKLMLAVLIDAIRTLSQEIITKRGIHRHAWLQDEIWVGNDDHADPFSFVNICAALGLDAGYVRRRIRHLQRGSQLFRVHRYAAKVEESWERQRATLGSPSGTSSAARRRAKLKRACAQRSAAQQFMGPLLLSHATHS